MGERDSEEESLAPLFQVGERDSVDPLSPEARG